MEEEVRCVVVGDSFVGKTCMCRSYAQLYSGISNRFSIFPYPLDNVPLPTTVDGTPVNLTLLDTRAHLENEWRRRLLYPKADVVLLCVSMVQPESLTSAYRRWYNELQQYIPCTPIIVVGTKQDLCTKVDTIRVMKHLAEKHAPLASSDGVRPVSYTHLTLPTKA